VFGNDVMNYYLIWVQDVVWRKNGFESQLACERFKLMFGKSFCKYICYLWM